MKNDCRDCEFVINSLGYTILGCKNPKLTTVFNKVTWQNEINPQVAEHVKDQCIEQDLWTEKVKKLRSFLGWVW